MGTAQGNQRGERELRQSALSPEKRDLVARLLREKGIDSGRMPIKPQSPDGLPAPLSFAQQALWLGQQRDPANCSYNVLCPFELRGRLNVTVLERALREIVRRHQVLRSTFPADQGEPAQSIDAEVRVDLQRVDLFAFPEKQRWAELQALLTRQLQTPFDLANGPLLRVTLARLSEDHHVLILALHHIVIDGWSAGVLLRELCQLYEAYSAGRPSPLKELDIQYADFAAWQRKTLQGPALSKLVDFWKTQLAGAADLQWPIDFRRSSTPTYRGARESLHLPRDRADRLRELGRREGATLFMTVLAAFKVLLYRYTGQEDILVGSPVTNRKRAELESLIGFFVNMVVLRTDASGNPTFRELLKRVRKSSLEAFDHQALPFDQLVEQLNPPRDPGRNPFFQVTFVVEGEPVAPVEASGLSIGVFKEESLAIRFDIEVFVLDEPGGLTLNFAYNADLFRETTLRRMVRHFRVLLDEIIAAPDTPISNLPLLDAGERDRLLTTWNRTERDFPRDACVHGLIEEWAARAPQQPAVEYGSDRLTYSELNSRANQLAHYLTTLGVTSGVRVGLCLDRSVELVVAMLAVLKAGGASVPLDSEYPKDRLSLLLSESDAPVVVTQSSLVAHLPRTAARVVCVDTERAAIATSDHTNPDRRSGPEDAAYVIFTSGSTGRPKGVVMVHRGVIRTMYDPDYLRLTPADRVGQAAVVSFDAAMFEIWAPLLQGACIVGVSRKISLHAGDLEEFLRSRQLTVLFLTTALFNQVAGDRPDAFRSLRCVMFGGQAADPAAVRAVMNADHPKEVLHLYGPAEVTTFGTWHRVLDVPEGAVTVPIGKPMSNTTAYLLDGALQLVPIGVPGELFLGGDGLAQGYLNQPELTAEKFLANPFGPGRLYRTGDWCRFRDDGALEFLGRRDSQVKLRGFRVELGEIQSVLSGHASVQESVVVARDDDQGDKRLVAYVVSSNGQSTTDDLWRDLRLHLSRQLPDFMVPSAFVRLDRLPMTPNGKTDLRALPPPSGRRQCGGSMVLPRTFLEKEIARVWCEVLSLEEVGVGDNFFDLGGHSLLLVRAQSRLAARLKREIGIAELFQFPSVETLAAHLEELGDKGTPRPEKQPAARPSRARSSVDDAVAIIGMAGRFPGAVDIEQLWSNLREGVESISFASDQELLEAGVEESLLRDPFYIKARGAIEGPDLFEPAFFGYTPRDAEIMDPQQRLMLECAWEALERGGYDPDRYTGSIGVFAGSTENSYMPFLLSRKEIRAAVGGLKVILSNGRDFLPTRISYKLNLRGPSVNVQTACSTSLVAVHLACRALKGHDCDMALAGGVSVTVPLRNGYMYTPEGIGSPDAHCRAFDAKAQGTVGGDGVAVVLLKRLADARRDGDTIHAVIRGSAINNDGSQKAGFTAPSVEGQAQVIAMAHADAGVGPETISYVEAHGTGTHLGDPVEIAALNKAFSNSPGRTAPCALASLKTNVGHLDTAAGVAGLIKAALSLERKELVPSLHFEQINPKIDLSAGLFYVNDRLKPWDAPDGAPRRAGVSSFGIGGTNAHVVLEEAPAEEGAAAETSSPSQPQVLVLSARTSSALDSMSRRMGEFLRREPAVNLADAAYTLQVGRREFEHRRAVLCSTVSEALSALDGSAAERVWSGSARAGGASVAFLLTGQGSQYVGMAEGLWREDETFRSAAAPCVAGFRSQGIDLENLLWSGSHDSTRLERTEASQAALFTVEYALAKVWQGWGVRPSAMIGHSIGEYVAACLSGVLSLEDAIRLVIVRGRLMGSMPEGAMTAVPLSEADLRAELGNELSLAAINGPQWCVAAGPVSAVENLEERLAQRELTCRRLHTSHAFHSWMMKEASQSLAEEFKKIRLNPPQIPYVSNVTGTWITANEATDPAYWSRHVREPVRFSQGLTTLLSEGLDVLLEVGPGSTLRGLAQGHPDRDTRTPCLSSIRGPREAVRPDGVWLRETLAKLWIAGVKVNWPGLHGNRRRRIPLPTYPFERQRYWIDAKRAEPTEAASTPAPSAAPATPTRRDLADWFYVPGWKRSVNVLSPSRRVRAEAERSCCLIFADRGGLAKELAAYLRTRQFKVVTVEIGDGFARIGSQKYALAPFRRSDYAALFSELKKAGQTPNIVAHFWAEGSAVVPVPGDGASPSDIGFYSLQYLAQALGESNPSDPIRLNIVTRNLYSVIGDEKVRPSQATVLGPCRVIPEEYPKIFCRNIDLRAECGEGSTEKDLALLAAEVTAKHGDPVVAHRRGGRWIQQFEPVSMPPAGIDGEERLRVGGVYLITGGLGGMGLTLARHLAESFRAKLILIGRKPLPSRDQFESYLDEHDEDDSICRRIREIQVMEAAGAEVMVAAVDVADREPLRAALSSVLDRFGRIDGVIHTAGLPGGGFIHTRSSEQVEAVLRPKVSGTRVLMGLLEEMNPNLDFVVFASSLASVIGLHGNVDYTAANAYLDAHAAQLNGASKAFVVSIGWGPWSETGMALNIEASGELKERMHSYLQNEGISNRQGVEAFRRILSYGVSPHVFVSPVPLRSHATESPARAGAETPKKPAAVSREPQTSTARATQARPSLSADYVAPRTELEKTLAGIWQDLFGVSPIGIHDNFFELGGDSVLNLQMMTKANQRGITLAPYQLFEHPTVAGLCATLDAKGSKAGAAPQSDGAARPKAKELEKIARLLGGAGGQA